MPVKFEISIVPYVITIVLRIPERNIAYDTGSKLEEFLKKTFPVLEVECICFNPYTIRAKHLPESAKEVKWAVEQVMKEYFESEETKKPS